MGDSIGVRVEGLDALEAALAEFKRRGADQEPVWRNGAEVLRLRKEEVFRTSGGHEPWKPRAESTLRGILQGAGKRGTWDDEVAKAAKRKRATSRLYTRILVRTGRLRDSDVAMHWRTGCQIGSNLDYARIHQLGGKAGKGRKVTIPARPHLQVYDSDILVICSDAAGWLVNAFTEGGAPGLRVGR